MKYTFYIVTHKQFTPPPLKNYRPIIVGGKTFEISNAIFDNTGDNISSKNPNYCELTALYWIWKNDTTSDFVSLNHYRRYFLDKSIFLSTNKLLSEEGAGRRLRQNDVILPYPRVRLHYSVSDWFIRTDGKQKDVDELRKTVLALYPDYINAYDYVMNGNEASYYNMFVMSKELCDRYCEWLFAILFKLESCIDISTYTKNEARIYGFLSERLLNVWVRKNNLKTCYLDVIETEKKIDNYELLKDRAKHFYLKLKGKSVI